MCLSGSLLSFFQLDFLWAQMSNRGPDDPFLSYRDVSGRLYCLTYKVFQMTIKDCAIAFGFDPAWFNPHSARMVAPTVLQAAGGSDREVLFLGFDKLETIHQLRHNSWTSLASNKANKEIDSSSIVISTIMIGYSGVALIISNVGVRLIRMGVHSTMMRHELYSFFQ